MNWTARFQNLSLRLSWVVMALGVLVLLGWLFNLTLLKNLLPELPAMRPNAALAFLLSGLALYLLHPMKPATRARLVGQGSAVVVLLIGLLTLGQYIFGWSLDIDQLLFRDPDTPPEHFPGRPSVTAAFCLAFSGLSLLCLPLPRFRPLQRVAAALVCAVGIFAIIAFLYGVTALDAVSAFSSIALHTAAGFVLLGFGLLLARPEHGFFQMLADEGAAGILMRRLFPSCFLIPALTGWLVSRGVDAGMYESSVGLALFAILTIITFSLITWSAARHVHIKEAEHLRAQKQFKTLFDESLDVILVVDGLDGRIISANESARRTLGYDPAALVGRHFASLFPPESEHEQMQYNMNLQAYGHTFVSHHFRRADGTLCPMDLTAAIIPWEKDRAVLVTLRDVTERKHLADEIQRAEQLHEQIEKERELMQLKEDFITMVSHDFRTPLAVIMTSGDMLERYYERLTEQRRAEQLQKIRQQVWYMTGLLDDVLLLGKARARKLEFNPAPADLKKICWSVLDESRATNQDKHIFQFHASGQFSGLVLDEKLIHRILANLMANAVKYSPEGGIIRLELTRDGDDVLMAVSDQGIGIPVKDQARLFEPFHRGSNTGSITGTGLGLAIVYESLQIHGGTITVDSREGAGTTFTIRLPVG